MNTKKLMDKIPYYLNYLSKVDYCKFIIDTNISIINRFQDYCLNNNLKYVDLEVIEEFNYNILKVNNFKGTYKYVVTRVMLSFWDYANDREIKFKYYKDKNIKLNNDIYKNLLNSYIDNVVNKGEISNVTKKRKIMVVTRLLNYLFERKITNISTLRESDVFNYLIFLNKKISNKSMQIYVGVLKEFFLYIYENNMINTHLISNLSIVNTSHEPTPKYFNKNEINLILDSIDIDEKNGRFHYAIFLLLITYGLRIGDILNLKFQNINFENNSINIIQLKTKKELHLYLNESVKFALLDYIKNERPKNINNKYIFITLHKPYRNYKTSRNPIYPVLSRIIKNANINKNDKKIGSRIFRHSLATNMINDNIPLNNIQSVLGHTTTKTTAKYITRDINKLSMFTLEVFDYD